MIIFKYIFVLYVVLLIIKMYLYIYFSVIRHIDILNFLVYNFSIVKELDSVNKKTKFFIVVIVFLSLLVISYGSFMNKIDTIFDDNNMSMDDLEQKNLLSNDDAKIIVKELEEKYYDYVSGLGVYCGDVANNDYITFGSY